MSEIAINVEGIGKRYRLGQLEPYKTLRDSIAGLGRRMLGRISATNAEPTDLWALRDVSFDVKQGEVVGIIGRNGAGKSTLLKILSRITEPTLGRAELTGRVGSLLEVGTGFHPELTGRENIYLNGAILGMTRGEIKAKFDEIVAFSEVEKFLDTPVKRYSSGMHVRLAFAVAAHLEPEILVVDEVLAVGDAAFQSKCLGKMSSVARQGRTILFVSHNMAAVEALCSRAILIDAGTVAASGEVSDVLARYANGVSHSEHASADLRSHPGRGRKAVPMMTTVALSDGAARPISALPMGSTLNVRVDYRSDSPISPVLGVSVKTSLGAPVFGVNNRFIPGYRLQQHAAGSASITCVIDQLPLMPGLYSLDLYFGDEKSDHDIVHDAIRFEVVAADVYGSGKLPSAGTGPFYWNAEFSLQAQACEQHPRLAAVL